MLEDYWFLQCLPQVESGVCNPPPSRRPSSSRGLHPGPACPASLLRAAGGCCSIYKCDAGLYCPFMDENEPTCKTWCAVPMLAWLFDAWLSVLHRSMRCACCSLAARLALLPVATASGCTILSSLHTLYHVCLTHAAQVPRRLRSRARSFPGSARRPQMSQPPATAASRNCARRERATVLPQMLPG